MTTTLPAVPIEQAIEAVADETRPIRERVRWYVPLRSLRLHIDRALRPVGREIQEAMSSAGAERWGPIRLSWKAIDPKYRVNEPEYHEDITAQDDLERWWNEGYRDFLVRIPAHIEVNVPALIEAMRSGDSMARDFYRLLNERGYRTEEGRAASITVDEHWQETET